MGDRALSLLGLMRRANALQVGETNTGAAVKEGKAKLVLLAHDASDNAVHRAEGFTYGRNAALVTLPYGKAELSSALGLPGCSMAAVTDIGFANAFMELMKQADAERYAEAAEEIKKRFDKAKKRKAEASTHDTKKRLGKRRTNA